MTHKGIVNKLNIWIDNIMKWEILHHDRLLSSKSTFHMSNMMDLLFLVNKKNSHTLTDNICNSFYCLGLYPKFPLPDRCFSNNGTIFYMSIFAKSTVMLVAVDLKSSQVNIIWQNIKNKFFGYDVVSPYASSPHAPVCLMPVHQLPVCHSQFAKWWR